MSIDDPLIRAQARLDPETGIFKLISWSELLTIVSSGALDKLTRSPTQLHEYQDWKARTVSTYGSIEQFLLTERLDWHVPISAHAMKPFRDERDWKCLKNDFPYAVESGITHLVIWTKVPLPTTSSGELSDPGKTALEEFIYGRLFVDVSRDRIIYFLNPPGLKSIANLEHFHVLLRDVDGSRYVTSQK